MGPNPQFPADLFTFNEEILKLHFCAVIDTLIECLLLRRQRYMQKFIQEFSQTAMMELFGENK